MSVKIDIPKMVEPIDEDMKLIMATLADLTPKSHKNYQKIIERSKAPVKEQLKTKDLISGKL